MKPVVIFLGGPPGSGKSTLAAEASTRVDDLHTVTAGELIRAGLGRVGGYVRPPVEDHERAALFQEVLIREFARVREQHDGPWLIDGHYAVPTGRGPAEIPPAIFRRLGCTHLVELAADVDIVCERLRSRGGAAWWDGSREAVAALLEADSRQAGVVGGHLGLDLVRLLPSTDTLEALVSMLGR